MWRALARWGRRLRYGRLMLLLAEAWCILQVGDETSAHGVEKLPGVGGWNAGARRRDLPTGVDDVPADAGEVTGQGGEDGAGLGGLLADALLVKQVAGDDG